MVAPWGVCVAARGHAWFYLGVHGSIWGGMHGFILGVSGFIRGACVVLFGVACMVLFGGHAWFYLEGCVWFYSGGGGMHGFISFFRYNEIVNESLGQGNIFTPVCHSVHRGACVVAPGGHAWLLPGGHVWLLPEGHAWLLCSGGHAWLLPGGCAWLLRGHAWFYSGGVWFYSGGMHGFIWGVVCGFIQGGMHGFFSFFGYNEIQSMSERYASYWNAFLLYYQFIYIN